MNDAFDWFGLPPDASERDVKRAYARRLKDVRPDEDPAAFQELHWHYQTALWWCRHGAALEEDDENVRGDEDGAVSASIESMDMRRAPEPSGVESHEEHDEAPWDRDLLLATFAQRARQGDADAMQAWLIAEPILWSLDNKTQVGDAIIALLESDTPPPMPREVFDVVVDFFDRRDIDSPWHSMHLERMRSRLDLEWRLQPGNEAALAIYKTNEYQQRDASLARRYLDALSGSLHLGKILRRGLSPRGPKDMVAFIDSLDGGRRDLPPPIVESHVAFWDRAADGSRLSWPRVGLMFARCTIVAVVAAAYLWMIVSAKSAAWTAALVYGCGAGFLSLTYVKRYFGWQAAAEYDDVRAPLLRFAWVPLLVGAGFAVPYATGQGVWSWVFCTLAFATMLFRYLRRNSGPAMYYGWMAYLIMVIVAIPYVSATVTLLLWAMDAWDHRRVLRFRRTRSPEFELPG